MHHVTISRISMCLLFLLAATVRGAERGPLRAGAARVDITPAAGAALQMSGYANRTQGFKGIHDHIYVRAIVLDDGATQAAVVAWELIFAPDAVFQGRAAGDHSEGRAAIRAFVESWWDSFAELRYEVGGFVILDDGVSLAVVNQEGRPVGVNAAVHQREGWAICWSADGLIERLAVRGDVDEARDAAERLAESRGAS